MAMKRAVPQAALAAGERPLAFARYFFTIGIQTSQR